MVKNYKLLITIHDESQKLSSYEKSSNGRKKREQKSIIREMHVNVFTRNNLLTFMVHSFANRI